MNKEKLKIFSIIIGLVVFTTAVTATAVVHPLLPSLMSIFGLPFVVLWGLTGLFVYMAAISLCRKTEDEIAERARIERIIRETLLGRCRE